jgi:outer membrane protein assembly factor BamB
MRTPRLVFVGDRHSRLTAIDVATGTSVWQFTAGPDAEIWSTLGGLSVRDVIFFGADLA